MKILLINSVCGNKSTGRICTDIADVLSQNGDECQIAFGRESAPDAYATISHRMGSDIDISLDGIQSRLFGHAGFYSKRVTNRFLQGVDAYQPDLIHLHNIHGYYLNVELLFQYIKQKKVPVIWTLHDCWAFTGHCSNYSEVGCDRWKSQCSECPLTGEYPKSFRDTSYLDYLKKKELFSNIQNLTIVTPSEWLASQVHQSFLSDYKTVVIPNGIDLEVFRPTALKRIDLVERLNEKKVILGVSTAWSEHKGLSKYYRLADLLGNSFQVVLVGLTERQCRQLPSNVIGIQRTNSVEELSGFYSLADCVVSLSTEETMGLTIVEGNACGTPAAVFNRTALPELITPQTGVVANTCTVESMVEAVVRVTEQMKFTVEQLRSHAQKYEKKRLYENYVKLYHRALGG